MRRNELKFFLRVQKKLQLRHRKGSKESQLCKNSCPTFPSDQVFSTFYSPFWAFSINLHSLPKTSLFGIKKSNVELDHVLRQPDMHQPPILQWPGGTPTNPSACLSDQILNMAQSSNSFALVSRPSCSHYSGLGHPNTRCPGNIRCWRCQNFGHTRKRCLSRSRLCLTWQPRFARGEGVHPPPDQERGNLLTGTTPSSFGNQKSRWVKIRN